MKKPAASKDLSVKAVKQKLDLAAAKIKEQQTDNRAGSDQAADAANTSQKAAMVANSRKVDLSKLVETADGKVSVTLKFSDKSAIDKFKLADDKVRVLQEGNKLKISGESADVRAALEKVLFLANVQQKSFKIGVEIASNGRSEKTTLLMDFSGNRSDFNIVFPN